MLVLLERSHLLIFKQTFRLQCKTTIIATCTSYILMKDHFTVHYLTCPVKKARPVKTVTIFTTNQTT